MKQSYGMIAGASALALAGVVAVQTGVVGPSSGEPQLAVAQSEAEAAGAPAATPGLAEDAEAQPVEMAAMSAAEGRLAELEAALDAREAALAELGATLTARNASIEEMTKALAERDAELSALRAEVDGLRTELAALRDRFAFDLQLAALKSGEAAPAGEAVLQPTADLAPAAAAERALTTIQFDTGSARLSPGGQVHAAAAAVMLAEMKLGTVRLVGFADRTGSRARNQALAEKRARAVADFLMAQGVPAGAIETAGVVDEALPVPTDPGVPEPLNRSVSIVAVPLPTT